MLEVGAEDSVRPQSMKIMEVRIRKDKRAKVK